MRTRPNLRRWLMITVVTLPLLQSGTCIDIATRSVITGSFDGLTPILDARLADRLATESP